MALTPRSGSSTTTPYRNDVENNIPNSQTDVANNMPYIGDSDHNKFAINTQAYPNTTKLLVGFMKGKRTLVTYYRLLGKGGGSIRTNNADYPATRNVLFNEYQKIINLEITLPAGFTFEPDPSTASVSITGEAKMYPGMNPSVGDIFTTAMGDGQIGVFQVTMVTPGTWRNDRIYIFRFSLQSFADNSDIDPIEGSVTLVSVFRKENYLGSTGALLSEQTYLDLEKIKAMRRNLLRFYHRTFLCSELNSYRRPDGVYDAYCIQFVANKMRLSDLYFRPKNLLGQRQDEYNGTLWGRLDDRYNTNLHGVYPAYTTRTHRRTALSVTANELLGCSVVVLQDDMETYQPYVLSRAFYNGDAEEMDAFEILVTEAIQQRTCGSLAALISEYLEPAYSLTKDEMYYKIPIYIHFIDMALQSQYREIDAPDMAYQSQGD